MATATKIKNAEGMRGDAIVVRLDPPFDGIEYVISSAVVLDVPGMALFDSFLGIDRSEETMIFPSNESGEVTSWGELAVVDTRDHAAALADLGYELTE